MSCYKNDGERLEYDWDGCFTYYNNPGIDFSGGCYYDDGSMQSDPEMCKAYY